MSFVKIFQHDDGIKWKQFSALQAICAGNSPIPGEFPTQRPVTRSFDVFFDLRLNKRLSKQSLGWWFETPSHPLWPHCNEWTIIIDPAWRNPPATGGAPHEKASNAELLCFISKQSVKNRWVTGHLRRLTSVIYYTDQLLIYRGQFVVMERTAKYIYVQV